MNDTLENVTIFPAGQLDADSFKGKSLPNEQFANGMLVPPLEADYLQYTPNNRLLNFLKIGLSTQETDVKSLQIATERAEAYYRQAIMTTDINSVLPNGDNSLVIVKTIYDEHRNSITAQEYEELQIGLSELTSEQMLKMIDEEARLIKVSMNDHLQIWTTIFCVVTTGLTLATLLSSGPTAAAPAAAKEAGKRALRKLISKFTTRVGLMYSSTMGRILTAGELVGDGLVTAREVMNVFDEMTDPYVRADKDSWTAVSRLMAKKPQPNSFSYKYIMKPSEMIGLLAIWERGTRTVLDNRLRNLIYGRAAAFSTDATTFSQIKFRINRIGANVERQIATPSLFPAFGLVLRVFAKTAAKRGVPLVGSLFTLGRWAFRVRQYDEQQKNR